MLIELKPEQRDITIKCLMDSIEHFTDMGHCGYPRAGRATMILVALELMQKTSSESSVFLEESDVRVLNDCKIILWEDGLQ